jgi:hypothetical protein
MSPPKRAPDPIARPLLARWVWERFPTWRDAGEFFEMSGEAVRAACLPFEDKARSVPRPATLERIRHLTGGAVPPESFYPSTASVAA